MIPLMQLIPGAQLDNGSEGGRGEEGSGENHDYNMSSQARMSFGPLSLESECMGSNPEPTT